MPELHCDYVVLEIHCAQAVLEMEHEMKDD
jgi:hypothetical protein